MDGRFALAAIAAARGVGGFLTFTLFFDPGGRPSLGGIVSIASGQEEGR